MGVLFDLEGTGEAVLHGVAETVQRPHSGVSSPGEDQPGSTSGSDQLVVDHVGGHPDQCQILLGLADHLMTGGDRDEMGEPLHGHRRPVGDEI
jgi:hypothetical protein